MARSRKYRPLEADVQSACLTLLASLGICHWRVNTGVARLIGKGGKARPVRYGTPGHSDIYAMLTVWHGEQKAAKPLFIECKRQGAKQSADQIAFQERVEAAGATYWVVMSAAEMITLLRSIGYPC